MRYFYSLVFYLAMPLVLARLLWRAYKAPAYAKRWGERLALFAKPNFAGKKVICLHSVSVGETIAAAPLIRALLKTYPEQQLVVTTSTPTGSAQVQRLFGEQVYHLYLPYDLPDAVARFLNKLQPQLLLIMETELWPNLLAACQRRGIPSLLLNGRMSAKSARGYHKLSALSRPMFASLSAVAAQSGADRERFIALGAEPERCQLSGNIKFDLQIDAATQTKAELLQQQWRNGTARPIFLAASTHQGEDEPLLQAFGKLLQASPEALLVLVPRHPERFEPVAKLIANEGFSLQRRSQQPPVANATQVLLGDSMGEMLAFFGAADYAFIGGSLVDTGGHNMIEAAVWAKPIVTGPSCFNFAEASALLLEAGALVQVADGAALAEHWQQLLQNPEQAKAMADAAQRVAASNGGALNKMLAAIDEQLI
ncbi:MAG: lipid IV(A) 3-deoxy-D-manno-octulosonic acid transferase [Cellvibrionaceae bacterium]|nr:lipid IV(A) 3-deoxy-D-manno-octulosonic acid transferase [Cellvibrionaceae bacterium]